MNTGTPGQLLKALGGLAAAAAFLAYNLGLFGGDPAPPHGGDVSALDGPGPQALQPAPAASLPGTTATPVAADPAPAEPLASPAGEAVARALSGEGPDWSTLFDRLLDRELALAEAEAQAAQVQAQAELVRASEPVDPPPAATSEAPVDEPVVEAPPPAVPRPTGRVTALVQSARQAVALVDGRLLRVGDELPSGAWVVVAIGSDRIQLQHPREEAAAWLYLEPWSADGPAAAGSAPAPGAAPFAGSSAAGPPAGGGDG